MIATGLCSMGGCFAQNESGRVEETYWMAAHCPVPYYDGLAILSVAFPGGSAVYDDFQAAGNFDWTPTGSDAWQAHMGIANAARSNSWVGGCFIARGEGAPRLNYNNQSREFASIHQNVSLMCKSCVARAEVNGSLIASITANYELKEMETRKFSIRYTNLRQFFYMSYSNRATGVKWYVMPMLSPSGAIAIWENYTSSLNEI